MILPTYLGIVILVSTVIPFVFAQEQLPPRVQDQIQLSTDELTIIFGSFAVGAIGVFLYLARNIILRRKTDYDKGDFESKRDKDYEKYHSEWSDDFEDIGSRKQMFTDEEFDEALRESKLPNYYQVLGVDKDALQEDIKKKFKELAKKYHPDKTKEPNADEKMTEINKAYEILSDEERREKYDKYFKFSNFD